MLRIAVLGGQRPRRAGAGGRARGRIFSEGRAAYRTTAPRAPPIGRGLQRGEKRLNALGAAGFDRACFSAIASGLGRAKSSFRLPLGTRREKRAETTPAKRPVGVPLGTGLPRGVAAAVMGEIGASVLIAEPRASKLRCFASCRQALCSPRAARPQASVRHANRTHRVFCRGCLSQIQPGRFMRSPSRKQNHSAAKIRPATQASPPA